MPHNRQAECALGRFALHALRCAACVWSALQECIKMLLADGDDDSGPSEVCRHYARTRSLT